jgi:phosphatidate cytidylyltransferase
MAGVIGALVDYRGDFMFRQRLISALLGIPLVVWLIWQGGYFFFLAVMIISSLALREFYTN